MENVIYYFTGTGNSRQIAEDISSAIGSCEVRNIADFEDNTDIAAERLGIVFPVYFWGLPLIVERFLRQIRLKNKPYVFALVNYGVWPGKALDQAAGLLKKRGIQLNAGFLIKMPDNYILWYGAKSQTVQNRCFEREKEKVESIGRIILTKKDAPLEKSKYGVDRLLSAPINRLSAKRFAEADRTFFADKKCRGCGLCERICPVNNIKLTDGKPVWGHHCESCLGCIQRCPAQAIQHGRLTRKRQRYLNPNVKW